MRISSFIGKSLLIAALVFVSATAANAQSLADIAKRGKVRIGVLVGAPPFGTIDMQGKVVGYDADVAALAARYLSLPLEVVPLTAPARVPALETGKVDFLVAQIQPTPSRAKSMMFTMPYFQFDAVIYGKKGLKIISLNDLTGKKIGVVRSSAQKEILIRRGPPNLNIVQFDDDATVSQALISGQVDAILTPDTVGDQAMKSRPDADMEAKIMFNHLPTSIAVKLDAFELRQWLNNFVFYVRTNGELDEISKKWVGKPVPTTLVF